MKKVLITGACGFLGRYAANFFFDRGWYVTGIGHGQWSEREWKSWGLTEWHSADITTDSLMTYAGEPAAIVHCAGSANVAFSMRHPRQDFERSVSTCLEVLEFSRAHSPAITVVFPSSAAVYGRTMSLPICEEHILNPVSPYGLHKLIGEQLINSYGQHYKVPACIVRFFSLYGPGLKKQILWDACNRLSHGEYSFFGTGLETRDFLHVRDAARLLYIAATKANTTCPVVNGGSGSHTAIKDVLIEIVKNLNSPETPVFLGSTRKGDPDHYLADINKALEWGWEAEYRLRDGIAEYVEWFRKNAIETV